MLLDASTLFPLAAVLPGANAEMMVGDTVVSNTTMMANWITDFILE